MGNTCGCVDPAEKQGEITVDQNKNNQQRQNQLSNYRDSTVRKSGMPVVAQQMMGTPFLFETEDPYLIKLM